MSVVYFIKPVDYPGPIKIGYTMHRASDRLSWLSMMSPIKLEVILTIDGARQDLEKNLHCCFADIHSHREWFHAAPRLLDFISALKGGVSIDEAIDLNDKRGSIRAHDLELARQAKGTSRETTTL